jgi:hypothetical protein
MLPAEHLLRHPVGRPVVVIEDGGETLFHPPARMAAEQVGQVYGSRLALTLCLTA